MDGEKAKIKVRRSVKAVPGFEAVALAGTV